MLTLVKFDDGLWGWNTDTEGCFQFKTAEQALAHFQITHAES